jgi:ankyrin repeat protein
MLVIWLYVPASAGSKDVPALQQAMLDRDHSAFRNLLESGADPGAGDAYGRTALHLAAMGKDTYWLNELLGRGTSPDLPNTITHAPPLFDALRARLPENIDRLLEGGARLDMRDRNGTTPLHQAAIVNDPASVLKFLEGGADPQSTDDTGATFQAYLYDGDPSILDWSTRRSFRKISDWLRAHDVPVTAEILETL